MAETQVNGDEVRIDARFDHVSARLERVEALLARLTRP